MLKQFIETTSSPKLDGPHKAVLHKLATLYGFWLVEKHLSIIYEGKYSRTFIILINKNNYLFITIGGYANGPLASVIVKGSVIDLCSSLKDEAVTLADAIVPPDFILNSVLGASNGRVSIFTNKCHSKIL